MIFKSNSTEEHKPVFLFICLLLVKKNKKEDQVTGHWECSFILEAEKFGRAELSDEL